MLVSTVGSMLAKSSCVPWTILDLALWVNVKIDTFGAVVTFAVLAVEPALGHLPEVIFVQELAVVALFAEASEPMFANDGL